MKENASRFNRCCFLTLVLLLTTVPLFAQYRDNLGGNWNNPASATITNIVMDRLARRRLEIVTATNGRQAIERCRQQPPPDLVIMDVQMPGMTGLQATGAIRALPGGADIPIVALTAQAMKGDRERILAAGCDDYLAKPVQPNELISVVDRLLRRAGSDATISPPVAPPAGPPPDKSTAEPSDGAHTPRR
jgi:CheY-like chemotaxis protein